MQRRYLLSLIILVLFMYSCATSSRNKSPDVSAGEAANGSLTVQDTSMSKNTETYKSIAVRKYKENIEYYWNAPRSHVLCLTRETSKLTNGMELPIAIQFFVYDSKSEKIIFEDRVVKGNALWKNDRQLEIYSAPGIVKGGEEEYEHWGYIYDVVSQKKIAQSGDKFRDDLYK